MNIRSVFMAALVLAAMSWAQTSSAPTASNTAALNQQNANNLCRFYFSDLKPGATVAQFEAGRKKHNAFHASQNDTFTWNTWEVVTGDHPGRYVTGTCGHSWKDFDDWEAKMGKTDTADAAVNLGPYLQGGSNGFYLYRADMSLAPANRPPTAMSQVTVYTLHAGAAPDFIAAIKRINDALNKQPDWPKVSGWLQLQNGGQAPTFVLLQDRKNWADFAPLPKTFMDVLTETYGKEESDAIQKTIRDATVRIDTEAANYRKDLSYVPAGK